MRILVVSHPPLAREIGAAHTALNLGAALTELGHEVEVFSPEPLPPSTRWFNRHLAQRRGIEHTVEERGPFDVIDLPAVSVSARIARAGFVVARSIQPDLDYLRVELAAQLRRRPWPSPRWPFHWLHAQWLAAEIRRGFRLAPVLLCLGTLERQSLARRFPSLAPKLEHYLHAPSAADRATFLVLRRERSERPAARSTRFLWLGRWVSHKGIETLTRFLEERGSSHPRDSFTIAGCGDDALRHLPRFLLESNRLRVVPSFTRKELPALLGAHDAGLFTSIVEGWGQSLQEMLESGMPVFATPAGGVPDLQPHFPSSLRPFPPPPKPEAREVENLAANGYYEHFSWHAIARRYQEMVKRRRASSEAPAAP